MATKIRDYIVENWSKGLITRIKGEASFPKGAASANLNWMTMGDHIELRRGQAVMGTDVSGSGRITGLKVVKKLNAELTQVLLAAYGRKVKYYDETTSDFIEYGTNMLPAEAEGEDVSIEEYDSLAGSFAFVSSPNSSIYKLGIATPGSYIDLQSKTWRGQIQVRNSAMYLWNRKDAYGGSDRTGVHRGWFDKDELADYQFTEKEARNTGNGVLTSFTGTLTAIDKATAANVYRTAMYLRMGAPVGAAKTVTAITQATQAQITSTAHGLTVGQFVTIEGVTGMTEINGQIALVTAVVDANNFTVDVNSTAYTSYSSGGTAMVAEVFTDQRDGTMTGTLGGSGTIDYITGEYTLTVSSAVTNTKTIYAEYYYEESNNSDSGTADSGAIADFSRSVPREALEGFSIRQDDGGGPMQNIFYLGEDSYCMHVTKTWRLTLSADDTDVVNKPYRQRVGIEYWRGGQETSEGILYIDTIDQLDAYIRRLETDNITGLAEPKTLSDNIIFTDYRFDYGVIYEYGDFILVACRHKNSTVNETTFVYNKIWKSWDQLDYRISVMDTYNGALVAGDSGSNNVFTLFSGLTDEESIIPNAWTSGPTEMDVEGIKVARRCLLAGLIAPDQEYELQLSLDNGPFVTYKTISGSGDYVDRSQRILVGANTLGTETVGGGGDGLEAYHYRYEFDLNTDKFEKLRYRFVATQIGYVSVAELQFKDIRYKGSRAALKYVQE